MIAELFVEDGGVLLPMLVVEEDDEVWEVPFKEGLEECLVCPFQQLPFVRLAGDLRGNGDDGAGGCASVGQEVMGKERAEGVSADVSEGVFVRNQAVQAVLRVWREDEEISHSGGQSRRILSSQSRT